MGKITNPFFLNSYILFLNRQFPLPSVLSHQKDIVSVHYMSSHRVFPWEVKKYNTVPDF